MQLAKTPIIMWQRLLVPLLLMCTPFVGVRCKVAPTNEAVTFSEPTDLIQRALDHDGYPWRTRRTPHALIYYQAGSLAQEHLGQLQSGVEDAVAHTVHLLDEQSYTRGIRIIMLNSRTQMQALTTLNVRGFAPPGHDAAFFVYTDQDRPFFRHEIFHLISMNLWGAPEPWIREGSAVYADDTCRQYDEAADTLSAYLLRENRLLPLQDVLVNFAAVSRENDLIAYMEAGSFFGFLMDTYGREAVRQIWRRGAESLGDVTGHDVRDLESAWRAHLATWHVPVDNWNEIVDAGC